jgi:hypothetical protein
VDRDWSMTLTLDPDNLSLNLAELLDLTLAIEQVPHPQDTASSIASVNRAEAGGHRGENLWSSAHRRS